jgi:hypothetical protein
MIISTCNQCKKVLIFYILHIQYLLGILHNTFPVLSYYRWLMAAMLNITSLDLRSPSVLPAMAERDSRYCLNVF